MAGGNKSGSPKVKKRKAQEEVQQRIAAEKEEGQIHAVRGMSEANLTEPPVIVTRCPRCAGRMMVDKTEGDAACFSCGNVVYRTPPMSSVEPVRREPRRTYHGWLELS